MTDTHTHIQTCSLTQPYTPSPPGASFYTQTNYFHTHCNRGLIFFNGDGRIAVSTVKHPSVKRPFSSNHILL